MQQPLAISDDTAFFYIGELVESAAPEKIFHQPVAKTHGRYVTGRFG